MHDHAQAKSGGNSTAAPASAAAELRVAEPVQPPVSAQLFQRAGGSAASPSPPGTPGPPAGGAPAGGSERGPFGVIVDDGLPPGAGQVSRGAFYARLAADIGRAADDVLRPAGYSTSDCPYLAHWLEFYRSRPAAYIERAIQRYARPAQADPDGLRDAVLERVRGSAREWLRTGRVRDLPAALQRRDGDGGDGHVPVQAQVERGAPPLAAGLDGRGVLAGLGPGRPLSAAQRAPAERGLGLDFGGVRVHDDARAGAAARAHHARALALGQHLVFAPRAFAPGTLEGDLLLGHELAHVAQQRGADPAAEPRASSSTLELHADQAAVAMVARSWPREQRLEALRARGRAGREAEELNARAEGLEPAPLTHGALRLQRCDDDSDGSGLNWAPAAAGTATETFEPGQVPGEIDPGSEVDGAIEFVFDGDGDQRKELRARITWTDPDQGIVHVELIQISSGASASADFTLPQPATIAGARPRLTALTDGRHPTCILFPSTDADDSGQELYIYPPEDTDTGRRYDVWRAERTTATMSLAGDEFVTSFELPPETEAPRPVFQAPAATTPAGITPATPEPPSARRVGRFWVLDVRVGAFNDPFRFTFYKTADGDATASGSVAVHTAGGAAGGKAFSVTCAGALDVKVLSAEGAALVVDLDGDGIAELEIRDRLEARPGVFDTTTDASRRRDHTLLLSGPGMDPEVEFEFLVRGGDVSAGAAAPGEDPAALWAASMAQAVTGLERQQELGSLAGEVTPEGELVNLGELNAIDAMLARLRAEAYDAGLLGAATFEASVALAQDFAVAQAQHETTGAVEAEWQTRAAQHARAFYSAFEAETERAVRRKSGGPGGWRYVNPFTDEQRIHNRRPAKSPGDELVADIEAGSWASAFTRYRKLMDGLDRWVAQRNIENYGEPDAAVAATQKSAQGKYLLALRAALVDIQGKAPARVSAVFHPAEPFEESGQITEIPLSLYYWQEGGEWHLKDLTNPDDTVEKTQTVAAGADGTPESEPPDSLLQRLEEGTHFPRGVIHYILPGGTVGAVTTTGPSTLRRVLTWGGVGLAAIGLGLVTFGKGTVAVIGGYALASSAAIGAGMAAYDIYEGARDGNLTGSRVVLDVAQIVAALSGVAAMRAGMLVRSAATAAADGAPLAVNSARLAFWAATSRYIVPLTATNLAADVVTLAVMSQELAQAYDAIDARVADPDKRARAKYMLLMQAALTLGLTAISVRGNVAEITLGRSVRIVTIDGVSYAIPEGLSLAGAALTKGRPSFSASTSDADVAAALKARADEVKQRLGEGSGGAAMAKVEELALRTAWRGEEARRLLEPLRTLLATLPAGPDHAALRSYIDEILAVLDNGVLSVQAKRESIITSLKALELNHPSLHGRLDFPALKASAGAIGEQGAAGVFVLDTRGQLTRGGASAGTLAQLAEKVRRANNAARAHGMAVEYALEMFPGWSPGTTHVQVRARTRATAPTAAEAAPDYFGVSAKAAAEAETARVGAAAQEMARLLEADPTSRVSLEANGQILINNQLYIHPARLAEIRAAAPGDIAALLAATRELDAAGGVLASVSSTTRDVLKRLAATPGTGAAAAGRYRLRFLHQRSEVDTLLVELGVNTHPLFQNLDDAAVVRLKDLAGEKPPRGTTDFRALARQFALERLGSRASATAPAGRLAAIREFVDLYQFFQAEFRLRAAAALTRFEARVDAQFAADQAAHAASPTPGARPPSRGRTRTALMTSEGHNGTDNAVLEWELKNAVAGAAPLAGADTFTLFGDAYAAMAARLSGRFGMHALPLEAGEDVRGLDPGDVAKRVQSMASADGKGLTFTTESAAVYHAHKHYGELDASEATSTKTGTARGPEEVELYLKSLGETVRNPGEPVTSTASQDGGARVYRFVRDVAGKKMTALVLVTNDGKVAVLTYFSPSP